jgi:PII-like signaling protein
MVEIVDTAEKIQALLPFLDEAVAEGLITIGACKESCVRNVAWV